MKSREWILARLWAITAELPHIQKSSITELLETALCAQASVLLELLEDAPQDLVDALEKEGVTV